MDMKIEYTYKMTEEERNELLSILWYLSAPQDYAAATLEKLHKEMPVKARRLHGLMIRDGEQY